MKLKKTEIHRQMSTKLTHRNEVEEDRDTPTAHRIKHRHEAEEDRDTPTAQKKKKLFLLSSSWIKDDNSIN